LVPPLEVADRGQHSGAVRSLRLLFHLSRPRLKTKEEGLDLDLDPDYLTAEFDHDLT